MYKPVRQQREEQKKVETKTTKNNIGGAKTKNAVATKGRKDMSTGAVAK
jgi:hypothetical protein